MCALMQSTPIPSAYQLSSEIDNERIIFTNFFGDNYKVKYKSSVLF